MGRVRGGDPDAFGRLYDVWFDRVHDLARRILGDDHRAADVAQDTFLTAWRKLGTLEDPASFGGWLLRICRNGALDRQRRDQRATAVDAEGFAVIEDTGAAAADAPAGFGAEDRAARLDDPSQVVADAEVVALVRAAAGALSGRDEEVLHLQLRHQLSPAEVGEVLGLNRNAANQACHRARERFARAFGGRLVWRNGSPRCAALRAELADAGLGGFDAEVVRLITAHTEGCGDCEQERRSRLAPSALFGAVGLVPALVATRESVAQALAGQGVPMGGSTALGAGAGAGAEVDAAVAPVADRTPSEVPLARDAAAGGEGPAGSEPEAAVSGGRWSERGPVAAPRMVVVAAVLAVLVLVTVFVVVRASERPRTVASSTGSAAGPAAAAGRQSTGIVGGSSTDRAAAATGSTGNGSSVVPSPGAPGPAAPGGQRTDSPPTASQPEHTTVTSVPAPVVERFQVDPSHDQPAAWSTARGPVLEWAVTGAVDVTIWQYHDDGKHGPVRQGIVATGPTGSVRLCPGAPVAGADDACTAPAGHYSYELVATGSNGSTLTPADWPGFRVLAPVIR